MRVPLKRLDRDEERRPREYVVADIETRKWIHYVIGGVYDGERVSLHASVRELLEDLFDHHAGKDCFCHFGGKFDFLFFIAEALKDEKRYQLGAIIPRGSGILSFDLYRLTDSDPDRISFRDSSALLPFGLKRLTENFGVEHLKKDYDHSKTKGITKELKKYLEYDLKGLYEVIQKFYDWPLIRESGGALTIASQAVRVWRARLPVAQIPSLSYKLDEKIRPSYQGGRVEIFKPLYPKSKAPLYLYDINSLYPYCMRTFDYPTKFKFRTVEWEPNLPGIYHCEVDMPEMRIPPLGTTESGKFIFPTGTFRGMYCSPEIEYARSLGAKIKIKVGYVFENGGPIFRDFVDELYQIKEKADPESVDYTLAKLLLNSCYGRTGIRSDKENIVLDDGSVGLRPLRELKVGRSTYRLMLKDCEVNTFSHVAIASFVTAYGRITTHRKIMESPDEAYYTDTDSIYTTHRYETGTKVGDLKLEYQCDEACFLLPKTYIAGKKIRMKGFDSKKIKEFSQSDFEACLEGDLKRLKIISEPKFATLRTAMKAGVLVTMTGGMTKQIRSRYDKRQIIKKEDGSYDTRALKFMNGEIAETVHEAVLTTSAKRKGKRGKFYERQQFSGSKRQVREQGRSRSPEVGSGRASRV